MTNFLKMKFSEYWRVQLFRTDFFSCTHLIICNFNGLFDMAGEFWTTCREVISFQLLVCMMALCAVVTYMMF